MKLTFLGATFTVTGSKYLLEVAEKKYLIDCGRGVALDTYEKEESVFFEDLSDQILLDDDLSRLLTFPNVLITAHQGFFTHEALSEIAKISVTNMQALALKTPFLPGTILN